MRFPTHPDSVIPHLDVNRDTGNFVYAVSKMPPGRQYMAAGTVCSWSEYIRLFTATTGIPAEYKQTPLAEMIELVPDREFGREVGDMLLYATDPGYDGGDNTLLGAADIRKVCLFCSFLSIPLPQMMYMLFLIGFVSRLESNVP